MLRYLSGKVAYLRAHYRTASDEALACALRLSAAEVAALLRDSGLRRTPEEKLAVKSGDSTRLPRYEPGLPRPDIRVPLDIREWLTGLACAAAALLVYLMTLAPTVAGEDSGELAAAAYTMGIPHPPGYPTWTMLGKLFTLIPFGTVAWRVNLMSACFAAAAASLLYLLCRKLRLPRWASASSALAFAFSRELWEQAVIAEVYTLNAFFFAACLLLLLAWHETRRPAPLLGFALLFGLSLGAHNTMALLGPVFVGFALTLDWAPWRRWRLYGGCVMLAAVAVVLVHLYLPLRAAADPPVNWGDPRNWENFRDVVTRAQYSFMFTEDPRGVMQFLRQAGTLALMYLQQFAPWLGFAALAGLLPLIRRGGAGGVLLAGCLVWLTLGYLVILNTRMERETIWISSVFYVPSWLILAAALGTGLAWVAEQAHRLPLPGAALPVLLLAASALSPLAWNYVHNDRSAYYFADDFGKNALATLDENAIYFPGADHATFPVMYLQAVEGLRPDVSIANKYGYPEPSVYADMPAELRAGFRKIPSKAEEHFIENWVIQNSQRPVYFSSRRDMSGLEGYELAETGLLFRVMRPGEVAPERDYWAEYTWHSLDEAETAGELSAGYILSDVFYMEARKHLKADETEAALALFDRVAALNPDNKETLNNLGSACAEKGQLDAAARYIDLALAADPAYGTALLNRAKVSLAQGQPAQALLRLEELLRADDRHAEAVRLSAECLVAVGWRDDAIARYEYLARLTPTDAALYRTLGDLYLSHKQDEATAQQYYAYSLELDPNQPELQTKVAKLLMPEAMEPPMPEIPDPAAGTGVPGVPGLPGLPQLPGLGELRAPGAAPNVPGF
jgi:tetratricopeptide (TPR) repeat protein